MIVMFFFIFIQSTSRYLLGTSFSWGSELAQYLHIWQIWIGASLAVRMHSHIKVDVFINLFSSKTKKYLNLIAILCWFFFAGFLVFVGSKYVSEVIYRGQVSPSL